MSLDELPTPAARPLTLADLPTVAAAILDSAGDLIAAFLEALRRAAQHFAAQVAAIARRVDDSVVLDLAAEVADTALVWAGSDEGQRALLLADTAMIGVRTADFYGHVGVYRPLAPGLVRDALERSRYEGPHDLRSLLADVGPASSNWTWITEGLLASPSLQDRGDLVADAIACIENGLWGPSVMTLLPVIEGVVADKSGVLEHMRVGLRLDKVLTGRALVRPDGFGDLIARPALRLIEDEVFARRAFDDMDISDGLLNRHAILHGRTVGHRTPEHALRVLMLLTALVELLDGPVLMQATDATPEPDDDLLNEFGLLLTLRRAGQDRAALGHPLWRAERLEARRARSLAGAVVP